MNTPIAIYDPIEVAIALSLYAYNIAAKERLERLVHHFDNTNEPGVHGWGLKHLFNDHNGLYLPTSLPYRLAKVYVEQALAEYGKGAKQRAACEEAWGNGQTSLQNS